MTTFDIILVRALAAVATTLVALFVTRVLSLCTCVTLHFTLFQCCWCSTIRASWLMESLDNCMIRRAPSKLPRPVLVGLILMLLGSLCASLYLTQSRIRGSWMVCLRQNSILSPCIRPSPWKEGMKWFACLDASNSVRGFSVLRRDAVSLRTILARCRWWIVASDNRRQLTFAASNSEKALRM